TRSASYNLKYAATTSSFSTLYGVCEFLDIVKLSLLRHATSDHTHTIAKEFNLLRIVRTIVIPCLAHALSCSTTPPDGLERIPLRVVHAKGFDNVNALSRVRIAATSWLCDVHFVVADTTAGIFFAHCFTLKTLV